MTPGPSAVGGGSVRRPVGRAGPERSRSGRRMEQAASGDGADRSATEPPPTKDPVGHPHPAAQYRSAEMGIGIREGAAPFPPVGEAGSHGAAPFPAHSGPLRRGALLRRRGQHDGVIALVCARSRWKTARTPQSRRRRPYFAPGRPYFAHPKRCEVCEVWEVWRPAAGGAGPPRGSRAATSFRDPDITIGLPDGEARSELRRDSGSQGGAPSPGDSGPSFRGPVLSSPRAS
jgi:hypothetical protein